MAGPEALQSVVSVPVVQYVGSSQMPSLAYVHESPLLPPVLLCREQPVFAFNLSHIAPTKPTILDMPLPQKRVCPSCDDGADPPRRCCSLHYQHDVCKGPLLSW